MTGDVLGQVASQTIENLSAVEGLTRVPVLRPLVATDKEAVVDMARRLGTAEWSVAADEDCCAVFQPRQPATRASRRRVSAVEAAWDVEALVRDAVAGAAFETVAPDWGA